MNVEGFERFGLTPPDWLVLAELLLNGPQYVNPNDYSMQVLSNMGLAATIVTNDGLFAIGATINGANVAAQVLRVQNIVEAREKLRAIQMLERVRNQA